MLRVRALRRVVWEPTSVPCLLRRRGGAVVSGDCRDRTIRPTWHSTPCSEPTPDDHYSAVPRLNAIYRPDRTQHSSTTEGDSEFDVC